MKNETKKERLPLFPAGGLGLCVILGILLIKVGVDQTSLVQKKTELAKEFYFFVAQEPPFFLMAIISTISLAGLLVHSKSTFHFYLFR